MAYLGRKKHVLMPKASIESRVKVLGVLVVRLHMDLMSLITNLSIFCIFEIQKVVVWNHILC